MVIAKEMKMSLKDYPISRIVEIVNEPGFKTIIISREKTCGFHDGSIGPADGRIEVYHTTNLQKDDIPHAREVIAYRQAFASLPDCDTIHTFIDRNHKFLQDISPRKFISLLLWDTSFVEEDWERALVDVYLKFHGKLILPHEVRTNGLFKIFKYPELLSYNRQPGVIQPPIYVKHGRLIIDGGTTTITPQMLNEIFHLPEINTITVLNLNNRGLTEIPETIANCRSLISLELNDNLLTALPVEISHLTQLIQINANNNNIKMLPLEIISMPSLKRLNVANNRITHFPLEIKELEFIPSINCLDNPIEYSPGLEEALLRNVKGNIMNAVINLMNGPASNMTPTQFLEHIKIDPLITYLGGPDVFFSSLFEEFKDLQSL